LADLGISLDETGHLAFDTKSFNGQNPAAIATFLGTSTSGGFLQTAGDQISSVADTVTGAIQGSLDSVKTQLTRDSDQITQQQTKIDTLQTNLQNQLSSADAAIAVLEQQVTFLTSLFQAANNPNPNA
jgi:flagellar capping protein FliD